MGRIRILSYVPLLGDFEHGLKCCNLDQKVMFDMESAKGDLDYLRQQCEVHCYICRNINPVLPFLKLKGINPMQPDAIDRYPSPWSIF